HVAATAGVAAAAVALALVVPPAVPGLSSSSLYALADGARLSGETVTTTHPLVSLRRNLSSTSDRPVLTYRTEAENPDYLRMYSLDAFDGQNWTMSRLRAEGDGNLDDEVLPSPPGQSYIESDRTTTEVTLANRFETDFLPMPYPPRELSASGEWYADPDTLMVFTTGAPARGDRYEVTSLVNEPAPDALAADMEPGGELDERYLNVPGSVDERTADLAASITSGADTAHGKAVALQEWFTGRGGFTYDLAPPSVPAGEDPLSYFLFDNRVGYCEQFAGAMALLARQAGIPARVAIGYTSGTGTGEGTWQVTESDAHAWPELYFQGAGWLRFEPTPASPGGQGTATVPDYSEGTPSAPQGGQAQRPQDPRNGGDAGASAGPEGPQDPTAESQSPAAAAEEDQNDLVGGLRDGGGPGRWWAL
ncbi:transglutaminaseTgpA domain-containing protein, partial [Streptomonospora algeriensis]